MKKTKKPTKKPLRKAGKKTSKRPASKPNTNTFPIRPVGDRIIVKEIIAEEVVTKTASGILLPDSVGKDKGTRRGRVVAVGIGRYVDGVLVPLEAEIGNTVVYQWGEKVYVKDEEYHVVSDSSVLAIIS